MIFSIETSCDETAAAVVEGRKALANTIYSQALIHKKWGGVVPSLAKRAHEEKIDWVLEETLRKLQKAGVKKGFDNMDFFAVTVGPGLAISLEVGIKKAQKLAVDYLKPLIPVNHLEGHIYSVFVQNSKGNPERRIEFPYLAFIVSGGHTELVLFEDHLKYKVIGRTLDDAAGEALDKAAKMLGLGYPGGPVIERLAKEVDNRDFYNFPRPMIRRPDLDFSFSGLKTSFYYFIKKSGEKFVVEHLKELASSFQEAVFDALVIKLERAMKRTGVCKVIVAGGVSVNRRFRLLVRRIVKKNNGKVLFPPFDYLTSDNAAMIGVAASFKAERGLYLKEKEILDLDRYPRLKLSDQPWKN